MNNLAELTEKLRIKDSEKTQLVQELEEMKEFQDESFIGRLRIQLSQTIPEWNENKQVVISVSNASDANLVSVSSITIKSLHYEEVVLVKQRNILISVKLEEKSMNDNVTSTLVESTFETSEVPDDMACKLELENGETRKIELMASFDSFEDLFQSKTLELEQVMKSLSEIRMAVKDASNTKKTTQSSAPKKMVKKTKLSKDKKTKKSNVTEESILMDSDNAITDSRSTINDILEISSFYLQKAIENRGYILFGLSIVMIHYFGDYASV